MTASWQHHRQTIEDVHALMRGIKPEDINERERLLWVLIGIHAGALTPVSEDEKRGMSRVLAILDRKLAEGGAVGGEEGYQRKHNDYYRARWTAFLECAMMLRSALEDAKRDSLPASADAGAEGGQHADR